MLKCGLPGQVMADHLVQPQACPNPQVVQVIFVKTKNIIIAQAQRIRFICTESHTSPVLFIKQIESSKPCSEPEQRIIFGDN